jgi:uncharacterized protein (TIGR02444 family)
VSLWEWTLEAYGREGVPQVCMTLQDAHGQNTSFLLWAVWAEAGDPALLARAAEAAKAWDAKVLSRIREIRRTLKPAFPPVDDAAREGLREDVKAVELRAERVLMETLADFAGAASGGTHALAALQAAAKAWGKPAPDDLLAQLAQALT